MATGIVKSFNHSKGYGFIRTESGKEIFVHLSAVQKAGLANLRKGQKISFEIFENNGKAAAKNLSSNRNQIENETARQSVADRVRNHARVEMSPKKGRAKLNGTRTLISRAALEVTIAEAVRSSGPECTALVGIIVERVAPKTPGGANWAVKGVKYGKAERDRCSASVIKCVEEGQRDFEISD
jgi:cold shock CspA family protein